MQKLIIFSIILLSTQVISAQIKSGEITYKVEAPKQFNDFIDSTITKENSKEVNNFLKQKYDQLKKTTPYLRFKLVFNPEASLFKAQKSMDSDNGTKINRTIGYTGGTGLFYINTPKERSIHQKKDFGKVWRVQRQTDTLNWRLKNEYKTIQGYKCQKATARYYIDLNTNFEIIAWFTPELPFQFGPDGISGLPGAILGLNYNGFYFYADHIKLSKKEKKIEKPSRGQLVPLEEFDKILLKNNPMERQYRESAN